MPITNANYFPLGSTINSDSINLNLISNNDYRNGIGVCFHETANMYNAHPEIFFTNDRFITTPPQNTLAEIIKILGL